jgi:hypothetical protein
MYVISIALYVILVEYGKQKKKQPHLSYYLLFCNESIPYTEYTIFWLVATCSLLEVH